MGLALEAKKEIAQFIAGAQQRLLGSEAEYLSHSEMAATVRVLDALVVVFTDGDEEYGQAVELALEELDPMALVDWDRDRLVEFYLKGGDAAPEGNSYSDPLVNEMFGEPFAHLGPDYCARHGNRVGSAPGGEYLCGPCESGE